MALGKTLSEITADLGDVLDAAPAAATEAARGRAPARTAPGQLMQFSAELSAYQQRVDELEAQLAAADRITIRLPDIEPNPWQPRKEFDDEALLELAESIRALGLLQPIVVRRKPGCDGLYQLVAGERRYRAHVLLGLSEISAVVHEAPDADMFVLALAENIGRANLSHYEICQSILLGEAEFKHQRPEFKTRTAMAAAFGMGRTRLYHYLSFERLPAFVIADLKAQPSLLGANAAFDIVQALEQLGRAALAPLKLCWAEFRAGRLDQTKIAGAVRRALVPAGADNTRDSQDFWLGQQKAATLTRAPKHLAIKIKAGLLSAEQEAQLTALLGSFFADNAAD